MPRERKDINKVSITQSVHGEKSSALTKYKQLFVGKEDLVSLIKYEVYSIFIMALPGAAGLLGRKFFLKQILGAIGGGTVLGRSVSLRCPNKIRLGARTTIDDNCLLDGRADNGLTIGDDVIIARDTIIQAKTASVRIGDRCSVGSQLQISSSGGVKIGNDVLIGGQSYIGGGMYHAEEKDVPFAKQGVYTRGPVIIEDNVWLGAGVTVVDGVRIGKGSIIGAGAIVARDVAPYTKMIPETPIRFTER